MTIYVPTTVQATMISCILNHADGSHAMNADLPFKEKAGAYDIFSGRRFGFFELRQPRKVQGGFGRRGFGAFGAHGDSQSG
jgi:hypothetical protein